LSTSTASWRSAVVPRWSEAISAYSVRKQFGYYLGERLPVAQAHPRCTVRRRNRGRQISSSSAQAAASSLPSPKFVVSSSPTPTPIGIADTCVDLTKGDPAAPPKKRFGGGSKSDTRSPRAELAWSKQRVIERGHVECDLSTGPRWPNTHLELDPQPRVVDYPL
jgi:hypothetical protein